MYLKTTFDDNRKEIKKKVNAATRDNKKLKYNIFFVFVFCVCIEINKKNKHNISKKKSLEEMTA